LAGIGLLSTIMGSELLLTTPLIDSCNETASTSQHGTLVSSFDASHTSHTIDCCDRYEKIFFN